MSLNPCLDWADDPFSAHSASSAILARIPFKSASTCEPYSAFGSLVADSSDPDKNHWVPFDSTCSPPGFLAQLRAERTTMDFSWLRNRTALVIGDSISREHVENFCILLGEESEVVRGSHKYSPTPSPIRATAKSSHVLDKPARLAQRGFRVVRDASLPRICYIPQYDFLVRRLVMIRVVLISRSSLPCSILDWIRRTTGASRACRNTLRQACSSTDSRT